ncbi:MAG: hypothetical protein NXH95_05370 [Pseudomonadaceae bacterium]|nr:hypothetical protein [Pseudomonadaceae bacterium]
MANDLLDSRLEGRLFNIDEHLYLVVSIDGERGFARTTTKQGAATRIVDFPIPEVRWRLFMEPEPA